MMKKLFLAAALLCATALAYWPHDVYAACASTIAGKDGTGTAITTCDTTDGSTGLVPSIGMLGGSNNANKLSITSNSAALIEGVGTAGSAAGGVNTVQGVASMTPILVQPQAVATGGGTGFTLNSAATTNATRVKNGAGTLYHISVQNKAAAEEFLIFFDSASSPPTCTGTAYYTIQVPAVTSTGNAVGGVVEDIAVGLNFTTGIGLCATTAIGGTGSVAANDLTINLVYK